MTVLVSSTSPEIIARTSPLPQASPAEPLVRDHERREVHKDPVSDWSSADALLYTLASALDDLEGVRKANAQRVWQMTNDGYPSDHTNVMQMTALVEDLQRLEAGTVKQLEKAMKAHPLGPWIQATVGIGLKQGARLLAAVGDPYVIAAAEYADGTIREQRCRRGPAELWAYCGFAPGQKRAKGVKSNWNADAKMRAYLVAVSCMKQMHSPYRLVYDAARLSWVDRDTSDLHKMNHALRCVAKALLKDLFVEARRLHTELDTSQPQHETHDQRAGVN